MTPPESTPILTARQQQALTFGLWAAILLNLALLVVEAVSGVPAYAANLTAIVICASALFMRRLRRLDGR